MIKHCQHFKHGFPYLEARISYLQARPGYATVINTVINQCVCLGHDILSMPD